MADTFSSFVNPGEVVHVAVGRESLRRLMTAMQVEIGQHLRKHGGNALESSSRSFGLVNRLAGMLDDAIGPVDANTNEEHQGPIYRFTCPDGHGWLFLAEYTECPFCGVPGARGEVWGGTWPAREG